MPSQKSSFISLIPKFLNFLNSLNLNFGVTFQSIFFSVPRAHLAVYPHVFVPLSTKLLFSEVLAVWAGLGVGSQKGS